MNKCFKISKFAVLALAASTLVNTTAFGHGYVESPKARQVFCEEQGGYWWPADGSGIPNLACRAAFLDDGYVPFTQSIEFAINITDFFNQQAVEAAIPAGTLCGGGSPQKDGIDIPSPHWQKTNVVPDANGNISVEFLATAPHNPSFWKFYLTNPGFNPATDQLTWDNISLVQEIGNIPFITKSDGRRFYVMDVAIPAGRTGEAVLFTRWQRDDVAGEGFYNCSDIVIGGDVTPPDWVPVGFFLRQTDQASAGDSVRVRLFSGTGSELIDQTLQITAANENSWQVELASSLNQNYPELVQIGVEQASGDIVFDSQNLVQNQVFTTSSDYAYNLSVSQGTGNQAPVVEPVADVSLQAGESVRFSITANDADNDPLTYSWSIPAPLLSTSNGAEVVITAPANSTTQQLNASVTVSDGTDDVTVAFKVDISDTQLPKWNADTIYVRDDKVTHKGKSYRARWWTRGDEPGTPSDSNPWEAL